MQHHFDQINSFRTGIWNKIPYVLSFLIGKIISLGLRKLVPLTPSSLIGRSQNLDNFVHLVCFVTSREQWRLIIEFSHYATEGKNIHRRIVVFRTEKQLRRSIPSRRDVVGVGRTRAYLPSEAVIANFDNVIIDEQVFGLHVPMEKPVFVHVGETISHLIDDIPDLDISYLISFYVNFLRCSLYRQYSS